MGQNSTGTVHVLYTVPVIAVVNLDTRKVDRVVICDEDIRLDARSDVEAPTSAVDIAEEATWPGWEFGW